LVQRIAVLDIPARFSGVAPAWLLRIACAILGVGVAVVLRALVDVVAPGVAPYAFVYPAVLIATLLGGWQAGAGTMALGLPAAWLFVVPRATLSGGQMHYQLAAILLNALTAAAVIAVAEGFGVASRKVVEERNAQLAERELLFRELQHRVGNDFAIVHRLLDLQWRQSGDPETKGALEKAMARIRSISRVHKHIYALPERVQVDLRHYLGDLCAGLLDSLPAGIDLSCQCDEAYVSRDRALALGLAMNEMITNAIKHGFPDGRSGAIRVNLSRTEDGWRLTVRDNGIGLPSGNRRVGLGTGLIEQFVRQTGGTLKAENQDGAIFSIDLPAGAAAPARLTGEPAKS
jgi:two-component sensor histidine kinase